MPIMKPPVGAAVPPGPGMPPGAGLPQGEFLYQLKIVQIVLLGSWEVIACCSTSRAPSKFYPCQHLYGL